MAVAFSLSLSSFLSFLSLPKSTLPHFLSLSFQLHFPVTQPIILAAGSTSSPPSAASTPLDISRILYPSLSYSNTLFFKSPYNVQVVVDEKDSDEGLLNRFKREVIKAGILQESKRRRFFENKREEKKRKARQAARRNRKRRPQPKVEARAKQEAPRKKMDEAEDNWDYFNVDLPFAELSSLVHKFYLHFMHAV